jgi:MFS family permease
VHLQEGLVSGDGDVARRLEKSTCCGLINTNNLRIVFFFGELVMMLAAGMTVKFFPIFFQEAADWSPAWVQGVFASLTIFTVAGTFAANSLAKRFGRMQVIIPFTCFGIVGSILLGALREHYHNKGVMVPVFIARCTGMWSISALLGSVLADYTPKATRARWKALASITSFGWSGSAAFGGWLIDRFGFSYTFVITGFFQASVIPVWCLLVPLIAKESEILATEAPAESPPGVSLQPCEEAAK